MTGLILKLAPNERVLINGAVIENGDRRAKISIRTPNANILRLINGNEPHIGQRCAVKEMCEED